MAQITVRKCPKCGTYHTLEKGVCTCGQFLRREIPMKIEEEQMYAPTVTTENKTACEKTVTKEDETEKIEVKEKSGKFIQTCPNCRKEFVLESKENRIRRCTGCGKARIAMIEPIFVEDAVPEDSIQDDTAATKKTEILDDLLETEAKKQQEEEHPGPLTLVSVPPYAGCRATFTWEDAPVLLGRSATLWEFLEQDGRVSNEHCFLCIEEGRWHVKDNHSRNSTLLNNRRVSSEKGLPLSVGNRITLGNQMDSMEFEVETV